MTRVAIIGGGIGGATAGCALAQAGLEVSIYEAAPELEEIGGGVALHPNAMRVLRMISGATVHRADLLDVIAAALPADSVTLGKRCSTVESHGDVAVARFADGSEIEADVIVGADGIHSRVRAALFGPDDPRFTGKICYRSVIPIDAVVGERRSTTATRSRNGLGGGSRSSAMRPIRCSPTLARGHARRSRMVRYSPPRCRPSPMI